MPGTMYEGELAKNNKLTDYGRKIVEENLWTVEYTISKFFPRTNAEREELCSIANEALVRAAIKFDLEKSIKFSTFAVTCIKSALCIFFKYFNQDQKFIKKKNNYLDAKEQKKIEEIRLSRKEQGYKEIEIKDEFARIIETILNSLKGNRRRISYI